MRILATGNKRSAQAGLTLVELIVVLVIMALVSAAVLTSLPPRQSASSVIAKEFATLCRQLSDRAIVEGRPMGIFVDGGGWQAAAFEEGEWIKSTLLRHEDEDQLTFNLMLNDEFILPEDAQNEEVVLSFQGRESPSTDIFMPPPIVFDPAGEVTPFTLSVVGGDELWQIEMSRFGEAEVLRAAS